ncbi:cell division protein FtsQ/DivIB [Gemmatimonadota bacterium]
MSRRRSKKRPGKPRRTTRQRRQQKRLLPRVGALLMALLLMSAIGIFARAALTGVSGATTFTVEEVTVEGTRYLDPAVLLALAEPERFTSGEVGEEDLEQLGTRVAAHPLVKNVAIRRSLPASVIIEVEEHVPVALLGGTPVQGIDEAGNLLEGLEPHRYGALPFITGVEPSGVISRRVSEVTDDMERQAALRRAIDVLCVLKEEIPHLYDTISEVRPGDGGEITLVLSRDAIHVRLREETIREKLPLVASLVQEGRERHGPISEVDLRFTDMVIYREMKGGE